MAIKFMIEQHASAYPSKVLAAEGGKHIYNIRLSEDADNGNFTGKGAWLAFDEYQQATPTTFSGKVQAVAANGNYYVEVVNPGDALFIYQVPMIEEEYNNTFKKETNFYNVGDVDAQTGKPIGDTVRAYELAVGDIIEISEAGFDSKPSVGATVALNAISGKTYTMNLA